MMLSLLAMAVKIRKVIVYTKTSTIEAYDEEDNKIITATIHDRTDFETLKKELIRVRGIKVEFR